MGASETDKVELKEFRVRWTFDVPVIAEDKNEAEMKALDWLDVDLMCVCDSDVETEEIEHER